MVACERTIAQAHKRTRCRTWTRIALGFAFPNWPSSGQLGFFYCFSNQRHLDSRKATKLR